MLTTKSIRSISKSTHQCTLIIAKTSIQHKITKLLLKYTSKLKTTKLMIGNNKPFCWTFLPPNETFSSLIWNFISMKLFDRTSLKDTFYKFETFCWNVIIITLHIITDCETRQSLL